MKKLPNDIISQSASYCLIVALVRYFYNSVSYNLFVRAISRITRISKHMASHSVAYNIFKNAFDLCKNKFSPILTLAIIAVIFFHLSLDYFMYGAIRYKIITILSILLAVIHFTGRSGFRIQAALIFRNSFLFKILRIFTAKI